MFRKSLTRHSLFFPIRSNIWFKYLTKRHKVYISLCSDIHLESVNRFPEKEFFKENPPKKDSKDDISVCVLAGDIGYPSLPLYRNFLEKTRKSFDRVLLVPGNHEYDDPNIINSKDVTLKFTKINSIIKNICLDTDCDFLCGRFSNLFLLKQIVFAGCTLWSDLTKITPTKRNHWKWCFHNWKHNADVEWIKEIKSFSNKIVLITHYSPSFLMIPKKYQHLKNHNYFASNLDHLIDPKQQYVRVKC